MLRSLGGCAGRILAASLLVLVLTLAWSNRHELSRLWERLTGTGVRATPELAARADEKLASLGEAGGPRRVALSASELQSLIEYRWAGFLPPDVVDPKVALGDGRVVLEGGVAMVRFGRETELEEIIAFLPDTAALRAVASFSPLDSAHVALEVHELGAAGIPVPGRLIPRVLDKFRGSSAPGLSPNALAVPLPPGIGNVYVREDSMVFVASETRME
jgi:hypothetical protein